ncbi:MAG: 4-alpha-glucanotransferase [Candidatus Competibacteraceae bacterium]
MPCHSKVSASADRRYTARGVAFEQYCEEMGEVLNRLALFDALHEAFCAQKEACWSWRDWPTDYHHPTSPLVTAFAAAKQERISYFKYNGSPTHS